ncbi:restriction endonuclease subunit S [Flavobacterium nackdongense]|uniref:Restriction endonuclease subunit S n=1 Tax=Flavobacterium nackdongense TaxID=2547394 RepID=A0A4P6YH60_9FLAO|nr:restriction endonuclease subunit S [Flavobacterium nackdongense]QBN20264.1 restriction endonuclease subunit S [Flavobacterium nackdongense]
MELVNSNLKKTELGLIPQDWSIYTVRDLIELLTDYDANGSFSSVAENVKSYDYEEYAWYVRSTDLENNSSMNKVKYVDKSSYNFLKKTALYGGELLFLKRGDIGNVYLFEMKTEKATVAPNLYLLKLNKITDSKYLYYYFTSNIGQLQLKSKNASSTLGALYKDDVKSIFVPLPPTLEEQTAIANALSDADNLIKGLEKVIAKKRNIKQGAMQKLLQPKEKWEVKSFKDLCWFQEGPGLRNWQFTKRGIKVINVTNLENGLLNLDRTDRHISLDEFHKMYEHFEIDENDIVVASSGNSYGKVAVVRKQDLPLLMNTSVIRFKPLSNLDYNFLLIYLKSSQFKNQIDLLITGGAQPNFGPVHLNQITINMPPTKEEQTKIASVLLDMDNEILALETKLEKYKSIKQGMMQNLLTGKIRLV